MVHNNITMTRGEMGHLINIYDFYFLHHHPPTISGGDGREAPSNLIVV